MTEQPESEAAASVEAVAECPPERGRVTVGPEEAAWAAHRLGKWPRMRNPAREAVQQLLTSGKRPTSLVPLVDVMAGRKRAKVGDRALAAWALGYASVPQDDELWVTAKLSVELFRRTDERWLGRGVARSMLAGLIPSLIGAVWLFWNPYEPFQPNLDQALYAILTGLFCSTPGLGVLLSPLIVPISMYIDKMTRQDLRSEAIRALLRLGSIHATWPLAGAANDSNARVRSLSRAGLLSLLPKLTVDHYGTMYRETTPKLCDAVESAPSDSPEHEHLMVAILDALGKVGDSRAIPTVEKLTQPNRFNWDWYQVRAAAIRVLPILYARRERERNTTLLLRSADGPEASLLRPAACGSGDAPESLLRATDEPLEPVEPLNG